MWWLRKVILLALLALVSACGFQPMYATKKTQPGQAAGLDQIEIAPAANRLNQLVRNDLLDRLTPQGKPRTPKFTLALQVTEVAAGVLITRADVVTRFNLVVTGRYTMIDKATGAEILSGSVNAFSAYNVVQSDYANLTAESAARQNAAKEVAEQIRERLALFFDQKKP